MSLFHRMTFWLPVSLSAVSVLFIGSVLAQKVATVLSTKLYYICELLCEGKKREME